MKEDTQNQVLNLRPEVLEIQSPTRNILEVLEIQPRDQKKVRLKVSDFTNSKYIFV